MSLSATTITALDGWCSPQPGISSTSSLLAAGRTLARALSRRTPRRQQPPARYRGGDRRAGALEQLHLVLRFPGGWLIAIPTITPPRSCRRASAAACPRGSSRKCARSAGWSTRSTPLSHGFATAACSGSTPGPARPKPPSSLAGAVRRERAADRDFTEDELDRAKAQMKAGLLMSLESSGARCEQLARHLLIHARPLIRPGDLIDKVEGVTPADAQRIAERLLVTPSASPRLGLSFMWQALTASRIHSAPSQAA